MSCEEHKADLGTFVRYLPETSLTTSVEVSLPEATLGGVPQHGSLLELSPAEVSFQKERFQNEDIRARVEWLAKKLASPSALARGDANAGQKAPVLYVAASYDTDVRSLRRFLDVVPEPVDLRLLFRVPTVRFADDGDQDAQAFAARLLAERDEAKRRALAKEGFAKYATCDEVEEALATVDGVPEEQRWPRLKAALTTAFEACDCDELDAPALKQLVIAEQRAGTMALGSLPLGFMRDERCGASMPLRSMQKLLKQIESFDQEFAGKWQEDELSFDKVVTNERLLNYFCDALPGETLAALQRARASVYWKLPNGECQAWRFEPLSLGAPMGTWRRVTEEPEASTELAFHYWQGAEQIRVFGPVPSPDSKATDRTRWACETEYEMKAVDETSIRLTGGRWFFTHKACQKAKVSSALSSSCVVKRALGEIMPEPEPAAGESLPTPKQ